MARRSRTYSLGKEMTRSELLGGFCYLPFYLVFLHWILLFVSSALHLGLSNLHLNILYCTINFLAAVVIFHGFLAASARSAGGRFWEFVQAVILGYALYYFLNLILSLGLGLFIPDYANPNDANVAGFLKESYWLTVVCTVVLAPVTEECLIRGLLFSNLHSKSRILAYVVSIFAFSFIHIYGYADAGIQTLVISALVYIPASVALAWTYEKSGTIWGPIALHAFINAISTGLLPRI